MVGFLLDSVGAGSWFCCWEQEKGKSHPKAAAHLHSVGLLVSY